MADNLTDNGKVSFSKLTKSFQKTNFNSFTSENDEYFNDSIVEVRDNIKVPEYSRITFYLNFENINKSTKYYEEILSNKDKMKESFNLPLDISLKVALSIFLEYINTLIIHKKIKVPLNNYKIKPIKRNSLPNYDYPCFDLNQKLKELNIKDFSVLVDASNIEPIQIKNIDHNNIFIDNKQKGCKCIIF